MARFLLHYPKTTTSCMNEPNEIERAATPNGAAGSAFAVGNIVAGRYVLLTHLGGGRFGPIFEAVDRALSGAGPERERRVALHALDGAAADDVLAALERWRAAPQSWLHPNVVKLLDFGRHGVTAYALTELLEGLTLRRVLDDIAPELLAPDESFAIVGKVGAALRYAHAKGVVHGDLRPETVFVTTSFGVKVLDFWPQGVAAANLYDPAAAGAAPATTSDDVYALACLAYELLTGRHPFNGNAPAEARRAELKPAPILGLAHRRWQAIARGLELEVAERTPSVAEFLAELGITGHEELPRSGQAPRAPPPPSAPAPRYAAAGRAAPVRAVHDVHEVHALDDADIPTLRSPVRVRRARTARTSKRRRSRFWLFVLPVVLVGGLAVALLRDYDEMRGAVTELIAASVSQVESLRESLPGEGARPSADAPATVEAAAENGAAAVTASTEQSANVAGTGRDTLAPASSEPVADVAAAPADDPRPAEPTLAEPTLAEPPPVEPPAERAGNPAVGGAEPRTAGSTTAAAPRRSSIGARAAEIGAAGRAQGDERASDAGTSSRAPGFTLVETRVTAVEGDALARVTIRHSGGDEPVRVFWWTGGHTAEADDDFADLEGVETLAPGASRDILVPLANDVWPEETESFFVYFGLELARRRTQTPAAQAEIVVVDDDR